MSVQAEKPRKPSRKARLSAARLTAVQSLYQMHVTGQDAMQVLRDYRDHTKGQELEGDHYVPAESDLLSRLVTGVQERQSDIAGMLEGAFKDKTPQDEPLLQAILACGMYELLAEHDTDTALIISEYLDVTGAFYDGDETRLVHGILDQMAKNLRP